MAKPSKSVTPDNRVERWKKLWGTPHRLDDVATDAAFDEFAEALVPSHMHKLFLKSFGQTRAQFGNRFFNDDASYQNWDTRLATLGATGTHVEVTIIYGSPDKLEAHAFRGEVRRTLKDVVIDDWFAACAIVRGGARTFYIFIEPKMRGCIVRAIRNEGVEEEEPEMPGPDEIIEG
jgi:hypothetical protein